MDEFPPMALSSPGSPFQQPTLTVIPFASLSGEREGWLSKGIADLLIRDLSEVRGLTILEREKMQVFAREVELQQSGLFNQEGALRLGRVAKVKEVIYGNYHLQGHKISINIFLLNLEHQKILQKESISGRLKDLRSLVRKLVFKFLKNRGVGLSKQEREKILFESTDSISATEHFYRAVDFYDHGQYAQAFGEFFAAQKQDPQYLEAHLWMGKMFEEQGFYGQAVLKYEKLYNAHSKRVEGLDALFFAGRILENDLGENQRAIDFYQKLANIPQSAPHKLEAAFQLGKLYAQEKRFLEAYEQFQIVDQFRSEFQKNSWLKLKIRIRTSRFVTWRHALNLYQDAIVQMVSLYGQFIQDLSPDQTPKPPRGVFIVDPKNPTIVEPKFGHTPSLFWDEHPHPDWREELYVVMAPKGYVATGVKMHITGQLLKRRSYFSYVIRILPFPLPREHFSNWLGVIYGQTRETATLKKMVPFYGKNRQVFALQLIGGAGRIDGWKVEVTLKKQPLRTSPAIAKEWMEPQGSKTFWEGMRVGRIPMKGKTRFGSTRRGDKEHYKIKKEMALLYRPGKRFKDKLFFVVAQGRLDGEQTDLWVSRSPDGKIWQDLQRANINSASDDYYPRLVLAEDGAVWLSWISNRRGKGWELWLSELQEDLNADENTQSLSWSHPLRIPVDQFVSSPAVQESQKSNVPRKQHPFDWSLLEYDLFQDRRGQWNVTFYSRETREMVFLRSSEVRDPKSWKKLASIASEELLFGPSFMEDQLGVYRMVALSSKKRLHVWSSYDGNNWQQAKHRTPFWNEMFLPTPVIQRVQATSLADGSLLVLLSGNVYGLQFARFHPDRQGPKLDLVTRVGLQAFAMTPLAHGEYLVALRESEEISFQKYRNFNVTGKPVEKDRNKPVYFETERDRAGNEWKRIFAQARMVIPDVTSVGVEKATGRIWWGIESGIFYKDRENYFAIDVSMGFFYHLITHIQSCGSRTYFASQYLNRPKLGYVPASTLGDENVNYNKPPPFKTREFGQLSGSIQALTCGPKNGDLIMGTSKGGILSVSEDLNEETPNFRYTLGDGVRITTLASDSKNKVLWVGTHDQGLFRIPGPSGKPEVVRGDFQRINSLAVDHRGVLWVAPAGKGLWRYQKNRWEQFTPENSPILYSSIKYLKADAQGGIWYLPGDDIPVRPEGGLGYFRDGKHQGFHPPHRWLEKTSGLDLDEEGNVWIGTWFDGLFELKRNKQSL